ARGRPGIRGPARRAWRDALPERFPPAVQRRVARSVPPRPGGAARARGGSVARRYPMASPSLTRVPISPTGMRLHEWIALERGYFQEQGIEPEIRWDVVRGQMASWKGKNYLERPQDQPFQGGEQTITNACAWGSICNAGAGMGKFVPDAYGVARWAIYVRPDSPIQRPADLANVPIAVGMRAGSHFNVPYRLEPYLPLEQIKTVNVGGFGARLTALLEGEVEATSLLDPQISMADQLGLRPVIANTFKTLWWVDPRYDRD